MKLFLNTDGAVKRKAWVGVLLVIAQLSVLQNAGAQGTGVGLGKAEAGALCDNAKAAGVANGNCDVAGISVGQGAMVRENWGKGRDEGCEVCACVQAALEKPGIAAGTEQAPFLNKENRHSTHDTENRVATRLTQIEHLLDRIHCESKKAHFWAMTTWFSIFAIVLSRALHGARK